MLTGKCKRIIQSTKRAYINVHLEAELERGNSRPLYKYVSAKRKARTNVSALKVDGETLDDPTQMAEAFNKAFCSVFTVDNGKVPEHTTRMAPGLCQSDILIHEKGVATLLSSLDPRKASGPDGLTTAILKKFSLQLAPILTSIFRHSLQLGTTPRDWRRANVCPVYKSGPVSNALNYRPIALTSVVCKTMEHILASEIREYLMENQLLADAQHGFRAKRSCESQLVVTHHTILSMIDTGKPVDAIVLDFSKAFDKVSHPKLIMKLNKIGINRKVTKWVEHWLSNRVQSVVVDGSTSESTTVTSGVPQGSVLGPLLFLLYINDIGDNIKNELRLFADDALLFGPVSTKTERDLLQSDLGRLSEWATTWQMTFNAGKCEVLHFSTDGTDCRTLYSLNNTTLASVKTGKYLGVTLSSDLSWSTHIEKTVNKANGLLGMLRRQLKGSSRHTRLTLYKTIVRPCLEYAAVVWCPSKQTEIAKLEKVQRRAVRWIHGSLSQRDSVSEAMLSLSLETLDARRVGNDKQLLEKMLNGDVDFDPRGFAVQTNPYPTRSNFTHISANSQLFYHSFFLRAVRHM